MRSGSVHIVLPCPNEETSFSRTSRTLACPGQVKMACWTVGGPVLQRGQVMSPFSLNQEGWAAK